MLHTWSERLENQKQILSGLLLTSGFWTSDTRYEVWRQGDLHSYLLRYKTGRALSEEAKPNCPYIDSWLKPFPTPSHRSKKIFHKMFTPEL